MARSHLNRQGFNTLLLTDTRVRTYRGNVKREQVVSLFGNYFFVWFDIMRDPWQRICHTYGVRRLFSADAETPIPVPQHSIDSLRACSTPTPTNDRIHPGCRAKVISGPLTMRNGEETSGIVQWTRNQRAALLLGMMQGEIEVEFDIASLELCDA
jgi:transcription antitermination factor NusG